MVKKIIETLVEIIGGLIALLTLLLIVVCIAWLIKIVLVQL